MLFVTSCGNKFRQTMIGARLSRNYNTPNVITVAGTDNRDAMYSSSNSVRTVFILERPLWTLNPPQKQNNYGFSTGTSMSAAWFLAPQLGIGVLPVQHRGVNRSDK